MEEQQQTRVERILVAVDGSQQSVNATRLALSIAKGTGARISFISIVEMSDVPTLMSETQSINSEDHAQVALGMAMKMALAMNVNAEVVLRKGHPASQINRFAEECKPDLIVLGSRGRSGTTGLLLGSVSSAVLKNTHYPILIVK
jgi:nucleotide-binding universal stress UspA family protein